ncbi:MAG: retron St85 family RNA-directed DNA polymerase [Armatimonadota bacterium]
MDTTLLRRSLESRIHDESYVQLCVEYAERLNENGLPVIFDNHHLASLLGIDIRLLLSFIFCTEKLYRTIEIPKKNSGKRKLSIPARSLKQAQRWILDNILYKISVSDYSTGFQKDSSILNNALRHTNHETVLVIDIKDFFPSVKFERVFNIFYYYGYTRELSFSLTRIVTINDELPQGSPTSPYISNIVCRKLDKRIASVATKNSVIYSRYADDLTLSGNTDIKKLYPIINKIINDEGFSVNIKKVRLYYKNQRQLVTGLVVNNDRPRVPREIKRYLRQQIYYCNRYGVENHLSRIGSTKGYYKEHLFGYAYFILMVEKDIGIDILAKLNSLQWNY